MSTDENRQAPPRTSPETPSEPQPGHGVLVRARNGDVIRYDSTGLVLRLSDRVIADIAMRLGTPGGAAAAPEPEPIDEEEVLARLEKIDAWNVRTEAGALRFTARLPGRQGQRDFRMERANGTVTADAPGRVLGILAIGGPRAALATTEPAGYPYHILAPGDDIGAVGVAGTETAPVTDLLDPLREMTHEALIAETFLDWQMAKHAPLPLFVIRAETDSSADAAALARGAALDNLLIAAGNIRRAASRLGKSARLYAVVLDFALEDLRHDALGYRDAMLDLMERIKTGLAAIGFDAPVFVARFDAGRPGQAPPAVIEGQWELMWNHGTHRFIGSAPDYMFDFDEYDRPTATSRRRMAEMSAAAIAAEAATTRHDPPLERGWRCPILHLAEIEPGAEPVLRVTARALGPLTLVPGAGTGFARPVGFALVGAATAPRIVSARIDPKDPQAVLLHLDRRPDAGEELRLSYGYGQPDANAVFALRDDWQLDSAAGERLHRWAMPAWLPVRAGGMQVPETASSADRASDAGSETGGEEA